MITLSEVAKSFSQWRESRQGKKEKIPDTLWKQVAGIYSSYPASKICSTLKLTGIQLKKAMQGDGFASFSSAAVMELTTEQQGKDMCEVSLERLGTKLTVKMPVCACDTILTKLVGYLP